MLARDRRLRQGRDIERVYRQGRYGNAEGLQVKARPSGLATARLVVVVPKKVSNKAVKRNQLRRRLIESARAQWQTVALGYDIVVTVRADLSDVTPTVLAERLRKALASAGAAVAGSTPKRGPHDQ